MEKGIERGMFDPRRNAFSNYFKSPDEFASVILNKLRRGEMASDEIKKNKVKFVSQLIGRSEAERLSGEEIDVFVSEAEKVISENKRMIDGSRKKMEEDALAAGFVDEGSYDLNGKKILRGDIEAYQAHMDSHGDDSE
jgi:uncharacterized protein YacL (UPF0231 family)